MRFRSPAVRGYRNWRHPDISCGHPSQREYSSHLPINLLHINSRADPDSICDLCGIAFFQPYLVSIHWIGPGEQNKTFGITVFPVGGVGNHAEELRVRQLIYTILRIGLHRETCIEEILTDHCRVGAMRPAVNLYRPAILRFVLIGEHVKLPLLELTFSDFAFRVTGLPIEFLKSSSQSLLFAHFFYVS